MNTGIGNSCLYGMRHVRLSPAILVLYLHFSPRTRLAHPTWGLDRSTLSTDLPNERSPGRPYHSHYHDSLLNRPCYVPTSLKPGALSLTWAAGSAPSCSQTSGELV
jgi:hypothetical protein